MSSPSTESAGDRFYLYVVFLFLDSLTKNFTRILDSLIMAAQFKVDLYLEIEPFIQ